MPANDKSDDDKLAKEAYIVAHAVAVRLGYPKPGMTYDDIVQEGVLAFLTARRDWKRDEETWLRMRWIIVQRDVQNAIAAQHPREVTWADYSPPEFSKSGNFRGFYNGYEGSEPAAPDVDDELRIFWEDVLAKLPERHRSIIRRVYYEGETLGSVAKTEGVSEVAVSTLIQRAFERIRKGTKI